ncbi:2',3'-cyclic-nucleotide 2'-phosphodiesterase (5'-nucleotidase family) [Anaerobacterium chartisolvens]|uniref:2',3'-cyclic-nucleotide 2'-phosphodiesterase (5'-nucleotidase family) n=1 Tax=Anaerobacterium chartisolvens TaxID=1297424 RepID=A0A369AT59_9FIRM|nr:bifunctional UDP-sugar hydrolase/5'-nucleotidase [Anaerobacterium chartisolvens]RCX12550.1 2',3'-cyclic-nucleotide 2'-phosphodiesterase (5'-nucleotidase family) [Anaerobacterium chartisolvens]
MKKYTNLIILIVVVALIPCYFIVKNVSIDDVLLRLGYYDDKITVVNTADVHGHIIYDDEVGGYYSLQDVSIIMGLPLIKSYVDDVRQKNEKVLFLDSGDMFHGTNEANVDQGQGVVEAANLMGYDAMVPGNHDFNFGFDRLLEIRNQLEFPVLSSNIYQYGERVFEDYRIIEMGGKKIGIFGLTTQGSLQYTNSKDNKGVELTEPIEEAKRVTGLLRGKVDSIILISHLGDDVDEQLAQQVDGIDLILCGHYHKLYNSWVKVRNTYMVEAGAWTTHVGIASMYFKEGRMVKLVWKVETTKDKSKIDEKVDAVGQKYHKIALENTSQVIARADVKLNGIRSQVRSKETNLANLLANAMRETVNADIALMNGGGIRESMPEGDITLYRIGKVLPFSNSLVLVEMKGEAIYDAVERGLRVYPSGMNGGFLQVSGIEYVFDGSKPAGKRLISITKDGKPLERDKLYKVATNDYLYNGGDNYEEMRDSKLISMGGLLKDILAKHVSEKGNVAPEEDGRIQVINERYK